MPTTTKKRAAPVVVEDDEEELEEEVRPARRPKASTSTKTTSKSNGTVARKSRPSEQAMAEATAPKRRVAVASPQSARSYVTNILLAGAPRDEVKKRAIAQAKADGADVSFKTFDVAYFIKHLEGKGYRVIEKNGNVRVIAPKG